MDQSSARLLQTDSDGTAAKPLLQARGPSLYRLRRVLQFPLLLLLAVGRCQSPVMLVVGPIDGHIRGPFWFGFRHWHCIHHLLFILPSRTGWPGSHEGLIVESRNRRLLSIRLRNQAHLAAR